jgi:hypothetical protein
MKKVLGISMGILAFTFMSFTSIEQDKGKQHIPEGGILGENSKLYSEVKGKESNLIIIFIAANKVPKKNVATKDYGTVSATMNKYL